MTAIQSEQEDNIRLRKAEEFVAHCREMEKAARLALIDAERQTKRARERREELFAECEARACARRKAGLIENSSCY